MAPTNSTKSAIFAGEYENPFGAGTGARFSSDAQLLWGCRRRNREGKDYVAVVDTVRGTEM